MNAKTIGIGGVVAILGLFFAVWQFDDRYAKAGDVSGIKKQLTIVEKNQTEHLKFEKQQAIYDLEDRIEELDKVVNPTPDEIAKMRLAAQRAQEILEKAFTNLKPGMSDWDAYNIVQKIATEKIPKYLEKDSFFQLRFTQAHFKIDYENNQVKLTTKKQLLNEYKLDKFVLPIPQHLDSSYVIKELRINPRGDGRWFEIEFVYLDHKKYEQVEENGNFLAIDLGINNFVSTIDNVTNQPYLYDGRKLKSINQSFNKRIANLRSIFTKGSRSKKASTKRIARLFRKRNNVIRDIFHKKSNKIVKYCLDNKISTIIVGKNNGWKQEINIGRRNNQNFVFLPYEKFLQMLEYKCERHNIKLVKVNESHTSKCDSLALEEVKHQKEYMGRRVTRGLFKSSTGKTINADINGAINISRKRKGESLNLWIETLARTGCVYQPVRIRSESAQTLNEAT